MMNGKQNTNPALTLPSLENKDVKYKNKAPTVSELYDFTKSAMKYGQIKFGTDSAGRAEIEAHYCDYYVLIYDHFTMAHCGDVKTDTDNNEKKATKPSFKQKFNQLKSFIAPTTSQLVVNIHDKEIEITNPAKKLAIMLPLYKRYVSRSM